MLDFEPFCQEHFVQQLLDHAHGRPELYPPVTMDSFNFASSAAYNTMPFSFYEGPALYAEAPQDYKYDMVRSGSQSSIQQPSSRHNDVPPTLLSSGSGPSIPSAPSSTIGSPYSGHTLILSRQEIYHSAHPFVCDDSFQDFANGHFDSDLAFAQDGKLQGSYVDPVLISGHRDSYLHTAPFDTQGIYPQPPQSTHYSPAASPAPSAHSYHSFSQPVTVNNFGIQGHHTRRPSISSQRSGNSPRTSASGDEDSKEKGRCPQLDCGRVFKDLKAHMLTHQSERPEKCPILNCEYNQKGFARKYDKNRHTLTHYKGTMVCGFCPGSGSAAEKSFNRADVFKRHLTSVHGVEQSAPNSRKRSPSKANIKLSSYCQDATGKCSTCSATFSNAQDFYEHLDDCVLRVVQQEEPCEAINAQRLSEMSLDADVQETLERHMIKSEDSMPSMEEDEDDEDDEEDDDEEPSFNERCGKGAIRSLKPTTSRAIIGGNISKKSAKKGMTWSKGGGSIIGKGRKRRKHYPPSWGMSTDKMNMKKRVLCIYDGQRRLLKDDMMMHSEFQVRMALPEGNAYVTDLDVETMKRAEAFHNATPEEKGPWVPEHDFFQEFMQ